jgi:hypothetical protein
MNIKEPKLESRKNGKSLFLLDNHTPGMGIDVLTTFQSNTDAATIAIQVEGANDIVTAVAISDGANPWDAGLHDVKPVNTALTAVKTTQAIFSLGTKVNLAPTPNVPPLWLIRRRPA